MDPANDGPPEDRILERNAPPPSERIFTWMA